MPDPLVGYVPPIKSACFIFQDLTPVLSRGVGCELIELLFFGINVPFGEMSWFTRACA